MFDKACVDFGKDIGYYRVLFDEISYIEPRTGNDLKMARGRINILRGGELSLNQAIVRKKGVDVLLDPVGQTKEFDTAVGQIAKDHDIFIGISLRNIIETNRAMRPRLLSNIRSTIGICRKMKNDLVIVSGAKGLYDMRAPQDLAAIGSLFGLTSAQSLWAISENPKALLERIK